MEGLNQIDDGGSWKRLVEETTAATEGKAELEALLTRRVVEQLLAAKSGYNRKIRKMGCYKKKPKKLVEVKRFYEPLCLVGGKQSTQQRQQQAKKQSKRKEEDGNYLNRSNKMGTGHSAFEFGLRFISN